MAIRALSGLAPEWYEPERETTDENGKVIQVDLPEGEIPTAFQIRPLSGVEYMETVETPGMAAIKKAFRFGLLDWKNLQDENGQEIEFSKAKAEAIIPARYILAIGRKILSVSSFDGEQAKN